MAQETDHNGMFIQGMQTADELAGFLRLRFPQVEMFAAYEDLLAGAKRTAETEKIPPLRAFWRLLDERFAEKSARLKCQRGCAFCCYTGVSVTRLEWDNMVDAAVRKGIDLRWLVERAKKSLDRVRQALAAGKNPDPAGWHNVVANHPCPFLSDEGACMVYEDRPLDCRMVVAFRDSCASKNLEHAQRGVWIEEAAGPTVIARLQHEETPRLRRRKFDGTQPLRLLQHWLIAWQEKGGKKR